MTRVAAKAAVRYIAVAILSVAAVSCRPRQPRAALPAPPPGASSPSGPRPQAAPIDRALARPDVIAVSAPLPGFMKGINVGNCLESPKEGAWGTVISEKHFEMAAAAGFDHVRLPVRFTTPERSVDRPPYTVQEAFFKRVDWAVDQALSRNLSIIVDVHHFEAIHKDPNANKDRLYAIWRQIATRYRARPAQVAFEILNEPNGALEPALLNQITAEALRIIREQNPSRLVFADGYFWASADHIATLELPADDPNVVAQFHMYQPILFTHQGAPWMEPWYQTQGIIFPAPPSAPVVPVQAAHDQSWVEQWFTGYNQLPPDENPGGPRTVFEHFDHAARWVKQHNQRVYLGEFGAIDAADPTSRENYVWLVRTEAERRGIGWAYWDDGGRFKAMDVRTGTWNEGLRRALLDQ
ncbi:MAG: glycoside hydrolase family 5 protein [Polyangiaceae bacterium]|nr:glycoside hydrolase family 5 protein [Polyangiaceae bacterium]